MVLMSANWIEVRFALQDNMGTTYKRQIVADVYFTVSLSRRQIPLELKNEYVQILFYSDLHRKLKYGYKAMQFVTKQDTHVQLRSEFCFNFNGQRTLCLIDWI